MAERNFVMGWEGGEAEHISDEIWDMQCIYIYLSIVGGCSNRDFLQIWPKHMKF